MARPLRRPAFSLTKMHSEYRDPKPLPGERPEPSIRVDAGKLLDLLLRAEVMMTAVDRRRYCDRAINAIQDVIADFQRAYDFNDERRCFQAKPGYTHNELLMQRYYFKLHKYHDKPREKKPTTVSAA